MPVETRACVFELDPRGFVRATMRAGVEMELVDAREAIAATARLTGGKRVPVMVDTRGLRRESKEARDHFLSAEAAQVASAVALIVGSPVSRMIANFFLRSGKLPTPTRLFTDEAEAAAWLLEGAR